MVQECAKNEDRRTGEGVLRLLRVEREVHVERELGREGGKGGGGGMGRTEWRGTEASSWVEDTERAKGQNGEGVGEVENGC